MPKIRIWNDNTIPHVENFKGEEIRILPGKYIDMEHYDGVQFIGQFRQPKTDGMGNQTRESMKMLRKEIIEPLFDDGNHSLETVDTYKCHACGKICVDQEHLDGHISANHLDTMVDKKAADKHSTKRR